MSSKLKSNWTLKKVTNILSESNLKLKFWPLMEVFYLIFYIEGVIL